jgi:hypothetical protein
MKLSIEKIIIALSCLVLIYIWYDYPVFDNKGIASVVAFSCLATITFAIAKIYSPTDKDDYKTVEKESDRLQELDGIFKYKKDGFYVTLDNKTDFIKWTEIIEVNTLIIPNHHSGLEIITSNNKYEFNDEYTEGLVKLGNQLYENLPDWKLDSQHIRMNTFGLGKVNLYKRENPQF